MNKQQLMAAFEKVLEEMSTMKEPPREMWAYPDAEVEVDFRIFCAGINYGETQ